MREANYDGVWIVAIISVFVLMLLFIIIVLISNFTKDKSAYPLRKGKFDEENGYSRKNRLTQYDKYNHRSHEKKDHK